MSDYIPEEVWPEILKFLPVKTLVVCTSVCKTWRSFITSSAFISLHLSSSRRRPLLFTRTPSSKNPRAFSLRSGADSGSNNPRVFSLRSGASSRDLLCPFPSYDPDVSFRVVGTVHGLVCLSDDILRYTYTVIIWNPSLRRSVQLPMPATNARAIGPYSFALGFGFDSLRNDYKVVRVVYLDGWNYEDNPQVPPLAEVYSLAEQRWKRVDASGIDYCITEYVWSQCFLHGSVHWIANKRTDVHENVILLFDLEKESFKMMMLPDCLASISPVSLSVSVVGGLLAVLERANEGVDESEPFKVGDDTKSPRTMTVWVKKGYGKGGSWTKVYTVSGKWEVKFALRLRRLREHGLDAREKTCGAEYDFDDIQLPSAYNVFHFNTCAPFSFTYTESLVLPHKRNGGLDALLVYKDEDWIQMYPESQIRAYQLTPMKEHMIRYGVQLSTKHVGVKAVI